MKRPCSHFTVTFARIVVGGILGSSHTRPENLATTWLLLRRKPPLHFLDLLLQGGCQRGVQLETLVEVFLRSCPVALRHPSQSSVSVGLGERWRELVSIFDFAAQSYL